MDVRQVGENVELLLETKGEPTEYRVSAESETGYSQWREFDSSISLSAALAEQEIVFLQMRRYVGTDENWLEARSREAGIFMPNPASSL